MELNIDYELVKSQISYTKKVPTLEESIEIVIQKESKFYIVVEFKVDMTTFITKVRESNSTSRDYNPKLSFTLYAVIHSYQKFARLDPKDNL